MFFSKKQRSPEENSGDTESKVDIPVSSSGESFTRDIKDIFHESADLIMMSPRQGVSFVYFDMLIDKSMLNRDIISQLGGDECTPDLLEEKINVGNIEQYVTVNPCVSALLSGAVLIHLEGYSSVLVVNIRSGDSRSLSKPENESIVIGPQLGFNESLSTNISLIRRYLVNPNLCNKSITMGKQTRTAVSLLYIEGVASEQMVQTVTQRISNIKIDGVLDSSLLMQLIEDNGLSIFPQLILTERPDRACSWLLNGKIVILVDGSSLVIGSPQSFVEFFQSMEDQNVKWQVASFLRMLRFIAMLLSVFFTAIYVASLTFHYEIIPQPLLIPLSESRSRVPFPPIIEALLLEFIIELLREAGARLPTKVGQTMGIVGGIVIGTAAVQAGFTSNILIIIVALGALASFTTPSFMMGNVIRILRFPIIILAGFWGFYGTMFAFCFLLIHLLRQTSLGSPFLAPFYPIRIKDWADSIIRLPLKYTSKRPYQARPMDSDKYKVDD
ncbi:MULTISPECIES: spore germination protein [Bacillaceae]|uniref:spore germination protein n=1 Tax=Bacillaceae TaxID=186817 RepID=UPI001C59AADB|nr:spore germination protein [Rossellomorea sp. YZS02]MBW3112418.1 spore germination protein [Bacillus sp. MCCB 382]MDX8342545.1 spore germination protein [Rossellomorea sp. YZS02]